MSVGITETYQLLQTVRTTLAAEGSAWILPTPLDCMMFAIEEMGEAVRASNKSDARYVRNNPNAGIESVLSELSDCTIMLMSALLDLTFDEFEVYEDCDLIEINHEVARAALYMREYHTTSRADLLRDSSEITKNAIGMIYGYPSMNLHHEVSGRLARIVRKHGVVGSAADYHEKWIGILGDYFLYCEE